MIIWGGAEDELSFSGASFEDGAAYDPQLDVWREIAAAPLSRRSGHVAVWTGSEMLVWGGTHRGAGYLLDDQGPGFRDGAAFDPANNTWRRIADSPAGWTAKATGTWTGTELVVARTARDGGEQVLEVMAYDPAVDTWTILPALASNLESEIYMASTGNDLLLRNYGSGMYRLADDASSWIALDPNLGDAGVFGPLAIASDRVFARTREYLGADADPRYRSSLVELDVRTGTWSSVPDPHGNLATEWLVAADNQLLFPEQRLAYHLEAAEWSELDMPPMAERMYEVEAWLGDRLAVWGGSEGDHMAAFAGGVIIAPQ